MGLLKPAKNTTAFAKIGMLGFEGSGKTYTAVSVALGICDLIKAKQVAFFDTETGSDFVIPRFKEKGIELFVHKGRAFRDLCNFIKECESSGVQVVIIDSISHVWKELCQAYQKKKNKSRLSMGDWVILKGQWQMFTDIYLNSKVHILMLGRAGYEYDFHQDDDGKMEIHKSGTKMKVEGEMGYEPSLLIEMLRIKKSEATRNPDAKGWVNKAVILKDRSNTINGMEFDYPTFDSFISFFKHLNIGGEHLGVDTESDSQELIEGSDYSYENRKRQRDIAIEELQSLLIKKGLDGTSANAKTGRVQLLEETFGTASKTAIENLRVEELLDGVKKIQEEINAG